MVSIGREDLPEKGVEEGADIRQCRTLAQDSVSCLGATGQTLKEYLTALEIALGIIDRRQYLSVGANEL
jgi:hypothetical protein